MRTIFIFDRFNASHAVELDGGPEPVHAHEWRVRVEFELDGAEAGGAAAASAVAEAIRPLEGIHLNNLGGPAGDGASAEAIARHLHGSIGDRLTATGLSLLRVDVEEEPGCWASYGERAASPPHRPDSG